MPTRSPGQRAPPIPSTRDARTGGGGRVAWLGRLVGPVLAVAVYLALGAGEQTLSDAGRATAAVGVLMAVWWMTEALPLPATALLPLAVFPVAGVLPLPETAAPYADPIIFLFMGGFLLALGMQRWELHRRIALLTLRVAGTSPRKLLAGFMVATATLSMWVSNTATAVMMLPIGLSVLGLIRDRGAGERQPGFRNLAVGLMLGIAYAASIGSVATPIGTPPNLLLRGYLDRTYGLEIGFAQWMAFGLPLAAVMLLAGWLLLGWVVYPTEITEIPGGRKLIRGELARLGRPSRGEWNVFVVFVLTATAWVLREPLTGWAWLLDRMPAVAGVTDAGIAVIAALVLFALPVDGRRGVFTLDWQTAAALPWNVLLLFGGGLSLATGIVATGVDDWIGQQLYALGTLPTLAVVAAVAVTVIFLTELTSNTATAATMLPVLGGLAGGLDVAPLLLLLPATVAASWAFMMPVATPPNAIVFASGHVRIADMVRAGFLLNLFGIVVVTVAAATLATWVFGL